MSKMGEYAMELSEALGHNGEFNDHVQAVYAAGCKITDDPDVLLEFVRVVCAGVETNFRLTQAAPALLSALVRLTKWKCLGSHYNLGSKTVQSDLDAARKAIGDAIGRA